MSKSCSNCKHIELDFWSAEDRSYQLQDILEFECAKGCFNNKHLTDDLKLISESEICINVFRKILGRAKKCKYYDQAK